MWVLLSSLLPGAPPQRDSLQTDVVLGLCELSMGLGPIKALYKLLKLGG